MAERWQQMVNLHFDGERYRDHALDTETLAEIQRFQSIVTNTAKALWMSRNPTCKQLPPKFENRTRLCFRIIKGGSTIIPLEARITQFNFWGSEQKIPEEITESIDIVYRAFKAASNNKKLPDECPQKLLPDYALLGKSLSEDEILEFAPPAKDMVRVTKHVRDRLASLAETSYQDEVDITGRVLEADVRQRKFQIWIDDKTNVSVTFTREQESVITTALKEHESMRLRVKGRGGFTSQGILKKITQVECLDSIQGEDSALDASAPRIEDVIADIFRDVPDEEWDRVPRDLSYRLDSYLYGRNKQ